MARRNKKERWRRDSFTNHRLPTSRRFASSPLSDVKVLEPFEFQATPSVLYSPPKFQNVNVSRNVSRNWRPPPSPVRAGVVLPGKTICSRRAERREVLSAMNKIGRTGQARPRWTPKSRIRCK